ncbi:MAG: histidine kinase, partial [Bacteroidales bacterium]|nr:histidine kinase [Bacteroidales bacterium]
MNIAFTKYYLFRVVLAVIISVLLMIMILSLSNKYQVELLSTQYSPESTIHYYQDLDFDGENELIFFYTDKEKNYFTFYALKNERIIDQWHFEGQIVNGYSPFFSDYDDDQSKELFLLFVRKDSVFLKIFDIINNKEEAKDLFLSKVYKINDAYEYSFKVINALDVNTDAYKEIYIQSTAGYSKKPRRLFAYFPKKDTVYSMPEESCLGIKDVIFFDMDKDSIVELILSNIATGNCKPDDEFSDMYGWLIVFTPEIKNKFSPVKLDAYPAETYTTPINTGKNTYLLVIHYYKGTEQYKSFAALYSTKGKLLKKKELKLNKNWEKAGIFLAGNNYKNINILLTDGTLFSIDSTLNITTLRKLKPKITGQVIKKDIDSDEEEEYISRGSELKSIVIYRQGFKDPVEIPFNELIGDIHLSRVKTENSKTKLCIDTNEYAYLFNYQLAFWHRYKFLLFLIIFAGVLLLFYFISKIIKYQKLKTENTQKKITALQIKSIQNQLNPYFTYQIFSSFEELMDHQDTEYANRLFDKYVQLLKTILINAEQVQVSLEEELNFVQSYLEIEKLRLSKKLDYIIKT